MKEQLSTVELPYEILVRIFRYFSLRTVLCLTFVCRRWNAVAKDRINVLLHVPPRVIDWSDANVFRNDKLNIEARHHLLYNMKKFYEVNESLFCPERFVLVTNSQFNAQFLQIKSNRREFYQNWMKMVLVGTPKTYRNLRSLCLKYLDIPREVMKTLIINLNPHVFLDLDLIDCPISDDCSVDKPLLEFICSSLPKLRKLTVYLYSENGQTKVDLQNHNLFLTEMAECLLVLTVDWMEFSPSKNGSIMFSKARLPYLRNLQIKTIKGSFSINCLAKLLSCYCDQLEFFALEEAVFDFKKKVSADLAKCSKLRGLSLECETQNELDLDYSFPAFKFPCFPQLEDFKLAISGYACLNPDNMGKFCFKFGNLRSLNIHLKPSNEQIDINDETIKVLVSSLGRSLEILVIQLPLRPKYLTTLAIRHVMKYCPNIIVLNIGAVISKRLVQCMVVGRFPRLAMLECFEEQNGELGKSIHTLFNKLRERRPNLWCPRWSYPASENLDEYKRRLHCLKKTLSEELRNYCDIDRLVRDLVRAF